MSDESEGRGGLPSGWAPATLGDVIRGFETGRNLSALGRPAAAFETGVLKISAVTSGSFRSTENKALNPGDQPLPHERVRQGDLLITRANTAELVGAVALVQEDQPNLMLPDKILRILYDSRAVSPRFLFHSMRSRQVRSHFEANATGSSDSMRNLSQPKLAAAPLVVPPVSEQQRIVAKLDDILERGRSAKAILSELPAMLERYQQSVLAAAFRGDLTADWREKNPEVEPASEWLKRIQTERRQRWEEAERAKLKAKGKTPTDDRWKGKYEEPEELVVVSSHSGIATWLALPLASISEKVTDGTHQPPPTTDHGIPFVVIGNVSRHGIDWEGVSKWVSQATFEELTRQFRPRGGDVIYTVVGSYGTSAVVPDDRPFVIQRHIALIRPLPLISPHFLAFMLNAPETKYWADEKARGNAQKTVILGDLRMCVIPTPPLAEQREIVRRIEATFAKIDAVSRVVTEQLARLDALDRATLKRAFRGELVPQDPSDEPASVLLERIRKERETMSARPPRRPRGKPAVPPSSSSQKPHPISSGRITPEKWPAYIAERGGEGVEVSALFLSSDLTPDAFYRELRALIVDHRLREVRRGVDVWIVAP